MREGGITDAFKRRGCEEKIDVPDNISEIPKD